MEKESIQGTPKGTGLDQDIQVGNFTFPPATCEGKSRTEIPVTLNSVFDFQRKELAAYSVSLITGGPIILHVVGGIDGSGWVPGLTGEITFFCAVAIDNVLNVDTATVRCAQSVAIAGRDFNFEVEKLVSELERDPACYV